MRYGGFPRRLSQSPRSSRRQRRRVPASCGISHGRTRGLQRRRSLPGSWRGPCASQWRYRPTTRSVVNDDVLSLPFGDRGRSRRANVDAECRAFAARCRHSGPRPSLFDVPPSPTLANLQHSYQIDPDLSIAKMILLFLTTAKMRLECAQGGNKDTRRRLLAYPSPIPTLLKRPLLQ